MPKKSSNPTTEDIAAQIETLRKDMSTLTEIVSEVSAAKVDEAKSSVKNTVDTGMNQMSEHATHYKTLTEESIRNQPVMATAVAATLGFAAGFLANRS